MSHFLPFVFLAAFASAFGIAWIIAGVDPNSAPWYIFVLLVLLFSVAIFGFLGLALYFVRTKFHKRYSVDWYIKTSFKMAAFIALFVGLVSALAVLKLVTTINLILVILVVCLLAWWSYLGKKN
ncbi:hypothetical protein A3A60_03760 [Candidatus Curtissbacteria bacterium RIFCSPLOWO2_01_FULL_42_26]|uniref:Uncharacterized protein n=1 Tax=Candidatus Curtissbacteria bacterium RIFCSPLOWO2_01_FULL_42_26 TaxID=1797729 RepID=A0A1F5HVK2_9BACT|nr:MAG: hypothetical protein A3A60_03760 [Candidatus Curtissbacteria bacterium RIFCSPLOWO2_01_FULL_42_26]